jgi:succinyl-diaminopimelate desuccinylase
MPATLNLLKQLIACASVTPNDDGCQEIISQRLSKLGFVIEKMRFGEVDNLWAKLGTQSPLVVFAGHTDVVPPGPLDKWQSPPFDPQERNGYLFGRGATDMKSGLAAMIVATENFIRTHPNYLGSIGFLITSDEEGPSINGTQKVIAELINRSEKIDFCIIGEASCDNLLGDQIRIGRRGSLNGKLTILGKQGHIAYPHIAKNPIHTAAAFLQEFTAIQWDQGNEFFPATSMQISNIHAGTGATNVIPGTLEITFNFRFGTANSIETLQTRVTSLLEKYQLDFDLQWSISGHPFLTKQGKLIQATQRAIKEITQLDCRLSTGGGTSDGRFIAPTGTEVVEFGPINTTAHQINEQVKIADLADLTKIYQQILEYLQVYSTS